MRFAFKYFVLVSLLMVFFFSCQKGNVYDIRKRKLIQTYARLVKYAQKESEKGVEKLLPPRKRKEYKKNDGVYQNVFKSKRPLKLFYEKKESKEIREIVSYTPDVLGDKGKVIVQNNSFPDEAYIINFKFNQEKRRWYLSEVYYANLK